jgi:DNA segregation ATPase FtsK/SpoIIIE, S-DNA-T family
MSESEPTLIEREVRALQTFEQLAADRARAEAETEKTFRGRRDEEKRHFQSQRARITTAARTETTETKAKYQAVRDEVIQKAEAETKAVETEYAAARKDVASKANSARSKAKKRQEETRWQALAVFEAGKDGAIKQFKLHELQIKAAAEHVEAVKVNAAPILHRVRRFTPPAPVDAEALSTPENPIEALQEAIKASEEHLGPVNKLFLPKFLALDAFIWPFLLLAGALAYPLGTSLGWGPGAGVASGLAVAAAIGVYIGLSKVARKQVARVYPAFSRSMAEAERLVDVSRTWAKTTFEQSKDQVELKRQRDAAQADERFALAVAEIDQRREQAARDVELKYPPLLQAIVDRRDAALKEADEFYPRRLSEIQERFQRETAQLNETYGKKKETTERLYSEAWQNLIENWRGGLAEVDSNAGFVKSESDRLFLDWHNADIDGWQPPASVPFGMKFGTLSVDLADIAQGIPSDERLKPFGPTYHVLPALVPFPGKGSVLIKAADAGKAEAVSLLQTLMLRYLTSVPPGKVRFTIIDPVGLGENFAAFMHLSDYSELLVTSRIWTESAQIDQRLADLSAHMENVIQKYLRNEFETIEEYNAFAGEVAEPFRVLVVANFPANFSETAARRLVSIASTGARCGVYTLISLDTKQQLPTGIQLKDLEQNCGNVVWREGRLQWRDRDLGKLPLTYDAPPSQDRFSRLMHKVGELARNANRVEVPFEFIAPTPDQYWTADSRAGIDVPLGRAGATKLQHLRLGKGTSQHVLIAGKTGSGKSTLLHALITNAALRYSPDELELYLIDFKKGVEFKVYAAMELPHARVIAVESEREFGLSVLQRLDAELKARGDRFRDLGVQDLNGYREADAGKNPLPRILFIVDEFQEFFVEDDKIAQEVALLLDRLVRQGRAFGIHVHLGSQSLGGAYSLARSTIGQMAVRIALQCSEADAHLILSEENSAARLLTRPGEAIYNDQNGMVEGNNFFQVVWLNDDRREEYLRTIRDLARSQNRPPVSQIVFEGNLPAVPSKNHLLAGFLQLPAWPEPPKADQAWLGEAIAIKDPTAAVFRPQSGSNLLIVGQNDEMALGIFEIAIISLATQHDPNGLQLILFDGSPADSHLAGRLGSIKNVLPHPVREGTTRDLAAIIGDLAAEVERRQKGEGGDAANIYLFVFDLQRFRDFRKSEDDFGYGRYGEAKADPPSKLFGNILRDGPPLGVHTVVWCDSLNNLNRTFDRQALREFEMRALFQMSANDSSTLIDAPAASRLGPNRALYFSEEEGRLEKFRPYGLPADEWLADVKTQFRSRPLPEPIAPPLNGHPEPATDETTEASGLGSTVSGI